MILEIESTDDLLNGKWIDVDWNNQAQAMQAIQFDFYEKNGVEKYYALREIQGVPISEPNYKISYNKMKKLVNKYC